MPDTDVGWLDKNRSMKAFLFTVFVLFPFMAFSQIEMHLSFNRTDRTLVLVVKNNTDKLFRLCPSFGQNYYEPGTASFVILQYKDLDGKLLFKKSLFVFNCQPDASQYVIGMFLFKYGENKYVYDLEELYKGNMNDIYEVEVHVQIEAVSLKDKKDVYKEKMDRILRW